MPYTIRGTFIFGGTEHGWEEILCFEQSDDNLTTAIGTMDTIAELRKVLLGAEYYIKAVRAQVVLDNAGNPIKGGSRVSRKRYTSPLNMPGDNPDSALLLSFYNTKSTKHRNMFMGGIWDDIDVQGGRFVNTPAGWISAFNSWRTAIQTIMGTPTTYPEGPAAAGWINSIKSPAYPVVGYTSGASQYITFTLTGNPFAGMTNGQTTTVRFSKMAGTNKSVLNRLMPVRVLTDNTCITVYPIAAAPSVADVGRMYRYTYQLLKAPAINPEEIRTRERGRPLLVSPGRRGNRAKT